MKRLTIATSLVVYVLVMLVPIMFNYAQADKNYDQAGADDEAPGSVQAAPHFRVLNSGNTTNHTGGTNTTSQPTP